MYVTLMDSLAENAVLTSTPLSLQTANKNNVLNKMVNQMPIYVQVLNASNSISRDNSIRKHDRLYNWNTEYLHIKIIVKNVSDILD